MAFVTQLTAALQAGSMVSLREMVTYWTLWFTRLSNVTVSNIVDSDHLPIIFHILDHVKIRNLSEPIEKFTGWERFQSVEADEAVREFTASIASAYIIWRYPKKNWSRVPDGRLTPGQTVRLTVGHKVTSTSISISTCLPRRYPAAGIHVTLLWRFTIVCEMQGL
jgi:hypothetical protein